MGQLDFCSHQNDPVNAVTIVFHMDQPSTSGDVANDAVYAVSEVLQSKKNYLPNPYNYR